ncbi:MAG TPA: amidohydrolase family protein, partial [Verrucomicrobiota bacterium]|nr:amidohydrolase family protein [Verrucomicrobiota bacterium]
DCAGLTVYPGFLDAYVPVGTNAPVANRDTMPIGADALAAAGQPRFFGVPGQERDPGQPGPGYGLPGVTPEFRVAAGWRPDEKQLGALREQGFTAAHFVPAQGIVRGQGAVAALGDDGPNESILRADAAQCVAFAPARADNQYPGSLMGAIAVVRQAFLDAAWHRAAGAGAPRPAFNTALEALARVADGQPVFFEPGSVLMADRAARVARELAIARPVLVASGHEWRRPDLLAGLGAPFVVPVAFPDLPKLPDDAWEDVTLDLLRAWDWAPENPALLRHGGAPVALTTFGLPDLKKFRAHLRAALDRGLSETDALAALTTVPAELLGPADRLGLVEPGRVASLTVVAGDYFDPEAPVRAVWVAGKVFELPAPPAPRTNDVAAATKRAEQRERMKERVARDPLAGRGVLTNPPALLVRGATLWTCGPAGVLTNASLLIRDGKVQAVGHFRAELTADTHAVDATGLHVTPGLIDCHSHSMIVGQVNEGTLPSTAMVRIGDVVNSETDNLHRQLAGGLTVANLLHGSANPIGGQNQVIKLRDGEGPEGLKFTNAPPGIKFALGENVKQSNWGDRQTNRFPQSRMGVQTFYVNRFTAARQYAARRGNGLRRDLELEALAEILAGTRLIHCHSYRQDEIVAFLRTMESFGVRVASLQHILEGYKVADEIARHGAGASAFADWWAFKFEVYDAIPYAGSLMHARGVNVSFNSDSSDHARRLNLEAAKAVKYGGTGEEDALKFVTLNPAKQLGIDRWVGSLEPGKDADFVLWSGHPLDTRSVCLQTWIEGRQYFDRSLEPERAKALADERAALVAKAKQLAGGGGESPSAAESARAAFFQTALEKARHLGVVECQDCLLP